MNLVEVTIALGELALGVDSLAFALFSLDTRQ